METLDFDANATTPLHPAAAEAIARADRDAWGNPASGHALGKKARQFLQAARESVARSLGAEHSGVVFTSGATESNRLAILSLAEEEPGHILASPIEHPCVIEPVKALATRGFEVEWLPVRADGTIDPAVVNERMRFETRMVTMMLANHETGAVNDVAAMNGFLHCDAAQAAGKVPIAFDDWFVATMSVSGHKFGGPRGVGVLLMKAECMHRLPRGEGRYPEQWYRPGTMPVSLACGLAAALEVAVNDLERNRVHWRSMRERFLAGLRGRVANMVVNGDGLPHTVNVSFPGCAGDQLMIALDLAGVACSMGAACASGSNLPSPVLAAMGVPEDVLRSAIRFSFRRDVTAEQIDDGVERIARCVKRMVR